MRVNEWFDEDFPDWYTTDTPETAKEGFERHEVIQRWGRRDNSRNVEWLELWCIYIYVNINLLIIYMI